MKSKDQLIEELKQKLLESLQTSPNVTPASTTLEEQQAQNDISNSQDKDMEIQRLSDLNEKLLETNRELTETLSRLQHQTQTQSSELLVRPPNGDRSEVVEKLRHTQETIAEAMKEMQSQALEYKKLIGNLDRTEQLLDAISTPDAEAPIFLDKSKPNTVAEQKNHNYYYSSCLIVRIRETQRKLVL